MNIDFTQLQEARRVIVEQGGRFEADRLRWVKRFEYIEATKCDKDGCHGLEGVSPEEAGHTAPFMLRIDRFHPGDFPCAKCGSTGWVSISEGEEA